MYAKGHGQYLWDTQGNRYLDCIAGYGVFNLGRNHPVVNQALQDLMNSDYPNLVKMDAPLISGLLAEEFIKRTPGMERVFFANSGAEGVEAAIKFARAATGKSRFIFMDHAYHGLTYGALSLNGDEHFKEGFGDMLQGCSMIHLNDLSALEYELKKKVMWPRLSLSLFKAKVYLSPMIPFSKTLRPCVKNTEAFLLRMKFKPVWVVQVDF